MSKRELENTLEGMYQKRKVILSAGEGLTKWTRSWFDKMDSKSDEMDLIGRYILKHELGKFECIIYF